jgi:hypothetical protein
MGAQKVDGLGRVHILPRFRSTKQILEMGERLLALDVKVKVKLPSTEILGKVSFLVRKG